MKRVSLAADSPNLLSSWSPKNSISPWDISAGSHKKVIWICDKGHEWSASVKNRVIAGSGCPYCSHRAVLQGYNDLTTTNPEIAKSWSPQNALDPTTVSQFSNRTVLWVCSKGHEWKARIADRTAGHGCPYCAGERVWTGFNDLQTTHPSIAKEWSDKNADIFPTTITAKSRKNVWWHCHKCNNDYKAVVDSRAKGLICPFCLAIDYGDRRKKKFNEMIIEQEYQSIIVQLSVIYYAGRRGMVVNTDDDSLTGMTITAYIKDLNLAVDACDCKKEISIKEYILERKGITYLCLSKELPELELIGRIRQAFFCSHIYSDNTLEEDIKLIREKWAIYAKKHLIPQESTNDL